MSQLICLSCTGKHSRLQPHRSAYSAIFILFKNRQLMAFPLSPVPRPRTPTDTARRPAAAAAACAGRTESMTSLSTNEGKGHGRSLSSVPRSGQWRRAWTRKGESVEHVLVALAETGRGSLRRSGDLYGRLRGVRPVHPWRAACSLLLWWFFFIGSGLLVGMRKKKLHWKKKRELSRL